MKIEMRHQWEVTQNTTKVKKKTVRATQTIVKMDIRCCVNSFINPFN